ncbi:MAG TPA: hybrid sensor histidine kinase/response regulator [Cyanobacteria bacterium UBA8156]|jgi:PAS domain S-box-containing protein|nr:hybrid sensor histidine kinase/response regulator [Cyanobacteria bacterium UBA8156]
MTSDFEASPSPEAALLSAEQLVQENQGYRRLFEQAAEGIFQTTAEGQYLRVNPALARIYGYASPAELLTNIRNIGAQLYVDPQQRQRFLDLMAAHGAVTDFEAEIYRKDGSTTWIVESAHRMCGADGTFLYFQGTVRDVGPQRRQERFWRQAAAAISELMRGALFALEFSAAVQRVLEVAAETLAVSRCSLWLAPPTQSDRLVCVDLYNAQMQTHGQGEELLARDFPAYFAFMQRERFLAAADAQSDPRTAEFTKSYLRPNHVMAMLDVAMWHRGVWRGVVCAETVGTGREWFPEEQTFLAEIADFCSLLLEIRDRQETERQLRASEASNRALIQAMPDLLLRVGWDGTYLAEPLGRERLRAIAHGERPFVGCTVFDSLPPDWANRKLQSIRQAILTGQMQTYEQCLDIQGQTVYEEVRVAAINSDEAMVWVRDITERKEVETQMQRALDEALGLNAILYNLAEGLLVVDRQGHVTHCNPVLRRLYALADGAVGRHYNTLPLGSLAAVVQEALADPREITVGEIELAADRFGRATATGVFRAASRDLENWVGVAVLVRDVTDEREVDRMKTEFIATVSHELRTPLTSVLGFAAIVKEKLGEDIAPLVTGAEKKYQRSLQRIEKNLNIIVTEAERLTSLIDDVLDIAKMEAGKIEWRMETTDIGEVVERALNATAALFEQSGLTCIQDIASSLPPVTGDRDRLIQVAINLISNAVKFTPQGGVTCRAWAEGDRVVFSVQDTGVGIVPADCAKVFDKFKQVGDTLTDKPKGTGLGLSICKQIVDYHRGRIWVESALGQGSTFLVSLPIATATTVPNLPVFNEFLSRLKRQVDPSTGKQILIVDDDPHIRELLRQELEGEGYTVWEAADGMAAIRQVKVQRPDLVILDVMMPQMNGFDAAAVLRNDPLTADVPILMLSIVQDRERGYRLGIDRYLPKPIAKGQLLNAIESLLHQGSSPKKVLIVDQNASTARTLAEVLQAKGYTVAAASNDREGLEKAISIQPDAIVIDALLSQNIDFVQALRFERGMENVVFVMLGDRQDGPWNL